jgi:tRNA(fMet)-specific endonuclease VapC
MENRRILVDTTILIDFLRKQKKEKSRLWKLREEYQNLTISAISVFELFAGATDDQKIEDVRKLLKWFDILDFDEKIAEESGEIFKKMRREKKLIEYRDLFIGTTAVFYDLKIATLNVKHFEHIPNLEILKIT